MIDIVSVIAALALLIYFAFRGVSLIVLAPIMATLAALLTGGLPLLAAYTQIFMTNLGGFVIAFFPLFLLGAMFGRLMDDSGSAQSIANAVIARLGRQQSILAVVVCCALLTYGGVSLFVVAFAIFPIAAALFREADIPKRLIPASLALGAFTFTMSALPGTPAIQNAIPMPFFGTTSFAAPGLGIITGFVMLSLGMAWLMRRAAAARLAGEGYGDHPDDVPEVEDHRTRQRALGEGSVPAEVSPPPDATVAGLPHPSLAFAPVALVVAVNFLFVELVVPRLDTSYLDEPIFGGTSIEAVRGVWSIIVALLASCLFILATSGRRLVDLRRSINGGAEASVLPIFNTASLVGFGAVIASLPAFQLVSDLVLNIGGGNPLISLAVAVNLLSAITGSASGGMSIALEALGPTYVAIAAETGTSLEAMHRVTSVASGALDALPHNGAVITVLAICNLTHRDSYFDIFMVAVVFPLVALCILVALASTLGSF